MAKLKSPSRNKIEELLIAERVTNGLKYAQGMNFFYQSLQPTCFIRGFSEVTSKLCCLKRCELPKNRALAHVHIHPPLCSWQNGTQFVKRFPSCYSQSLWSSTSTQVLQPRYRPFVEPHSFPSVNQRLYGWNVEEKRNPFGGNQHHWP